MKFKKIMQPDTYPTESAIPLKKGSSDIIIFDSFIEDPLFFDQEIYNEWINGTPSIIQLLF